MELITGILKNIPDALSLGILWSVMALGVYITFKILDIADMTVDGSFAMGGCVSAVLIANGFHPLLSIVASVLCGMIAGLVTGFLHAKLKIPAILAGILTMLSLYSINLKILSGRSNLAMPALGQQKLETIIDIVQDLTGLTARDANLLFGVLVAGLLIGLLYWFFGTELGSAIRATGNNTDMVRALGVSTDRMKIIGLVIANGLVALSGSIVAQSQRYADVGMGTGTIVIGLASIIIGQVILGQDRPFAIKLLSVIAGSILYRIVIAVVLRMGMNPNDLKLLTAIIVGIALSFPVAKKMLLAKLRIHANGRANQKEAAAHVDD